MACNAFYQAVYFLKRSLRTFYSGVCIFCTEQSIQYCANCISTMHCTFRLLHINLLSKVYICTSSLQLWQKNLLFSCAFCNLQFLTVITWNPWSLTVQSPFYSGVYILRSNIRFTAASVCVWGSLRHKFYESLRDNKKIDWMCYNLDTACFTTWIQCVISWIRCNTT